METRTQNLRLSQYSALYAGLGWVTEVLECHGTDGFLEISGLLGGLHDDEQATS